MSHGSLNQIMGTRFDMLILEKSREEADLIWNTVVNELRRLDRMLNRFDPLSEVSSINRQAAKNPCSVSQEMWEVLIACQHFHRQTAGLFDITLHDFSALHLAETDHSVQFTHPGITIDFGGYAKGYAVRKIQHYLKSLSVQNCFVDFGNSAILGLGHHPYGDSWKVSIVSPYPSKNILGEVSLKDEALSVSGNSATYTAHIMRPGSGEAVNERKVVAVTSFNPLDAEVLSTSLMIANSDEKRLLKEIFVKHHFLEYSM